MLYRGTEITGRLRGQSDNAVGKLSSIQEPHMLLTQERDTLRSEYEELKINYNELKRECSDLKDNINAIIEESDALHRDRDNLVDSEGRVIMME
jgi:predicted nuclease with TOPRIM domain